MGAAVAVTFGITVMAMNVVMSPSWVVGGGGGGIRGSATDRHPFDDNRFDPTASDHDGVTDLKHRGLGVNDLGVGTHPHSAPPEPPEPTVPALSPPTPAAATTATAVAPLDAPPRGVVPFVSIITLSSGQHFLDRNTLMNALYMSYPHDRLELLVVETNGRGPSELFMKWNKTLSDEAYRRGHDYPTFKYWYFKPDPRFLTGGKRNFLLDNVQGDIIVHLDNDDIGTPGYIKTVVKIFTDGATDPGFRVSKGSKNVTTKCCRDGSDGPYLRDMINQAAFSRGIFQPDGSAEFSAETGQNKIGALTSYTHTLSKKCRFGNTQTMEEFRFFGCAGADFSVHECKRDDMPGGADQQLLRFIHPLSITSMGWYVDRVKWNQLTGVDLDRLYRSISGWYEWLHELTRPIEIPRLAPGEGASRFSEMPRSRMGAWHDFHAGHPKLLTGGEYPYCEGYVATPGQQWPKPPAVPDAIVAATDAKDCCNKCKGQAADKSCNAFTFNKTAALGCAMMVSGADDLPDLTFKGHLDNGAYFYEFESAVLLKTCHKCGGVGGFKIPK